MARQSAMARAVGAWLLHARREHAPVVSFAPDRELVRPARNGPEVERRSNRRDEVSNLGDRMRRRPRLQIRVENLDIVRPRLRADRQQQREFNDAGRDKATGSGRSPLCSLRSTEYLRKSSSVRSSAICDWLVAVGWLRGRSLAL